MARASLTCALLGAILALAAARSAAAATNCSSLIGCSDCVEANFTRSANGSRPGRHGHRGLRHLMRGGRGGGPNGDGSRGGPGDGSGDRPNGGGSGDGSSGRPGGFPGGPGGPDGFPGGEPDGARLVCIACDAAAHFVLPPNDTFGGRPGHGRGPPHCVCEDAYGLVVDNSTAPPTFSCEPCTDNTVPLGPKSNVTLAYDPATGSWTLQLGGSGGPPPRPPRGDSRGAPPPRPPYAPGSCVECPDGSSTSDNIVCVADA